jgi:hypothetical protein
MLELASAASGAARGAHFMSIALQTKSDSV